MCADRSRIKSIAHEIPGWLHDEDVELLYRSAMRVPAGSCIVEIGSWVGKSTVVLAEGSLSGNKVPVYAVDPHEGGMEHAREGVLNTLQSFRSNIERFGVKELVHEVVATSQSASMPSCPIGLLFIDGDHEYESVRMDFDLWVPHVISGGVVILHDVVAWWPGPTRVAIESVKNNPMFGNVQQIGYCLYAERMR